MDRSYLLPLGALIAALVPACASVDIHVHNLFELHQDDGRARFVADLASPLEWALGDGEGIRLHLAEGAGEDDPEAIDDPYRECLETLVELADADSRHPRTAGLQVEVFSWLAIDDIYVLSRERCLLELERHAARLGVQAPSVAPVPAATPQQLEAALARLQDQAYPALLVTAESEAALVAFDPTELRSACEAVAALPLDRPGGRRALAFCNIVLGLHGRSSGPQERLAAQPLYALQEDLQRRMVAQSLEAALGDPSGWNRGIAFRIALGLPGSPRDELLERAFADRDRRVHIGAARGLRSEVPTTGPQTGGLLTGGLPTGGTAPRPLDERWIDYLLRMTESVDGRVSTEACRTLEVVSGAGLQSLRPEDWRRWDRRRNG